MRPFLLGSHLTLGCRSQGWRGPALSLPWHLAGDNCYCSRLYLWTSCELLGFCLNMQISPRSLAPLSTPHLSCAAVQSGKGCKTQTQPSVLFACPEITSDGFLLDLSPFCPSLAYLFSFPLYDIHRIRVSHLPYTETMQALVA